MAYNRTNYLKRAKQIIDVYFEVKQQHIPDTFIVRTIFPKRGIFISYNTWVNIKGLKQSEFKQVMLIAV